jgi:hypothetical protein
MARTGESPKNIRRKHASESLCGHAIDTHLRFEYPGIVDERTQGAEGSIARLE